MLVVRGKTIEELDAAAFDALVARHERVLVDVGTGDGRFAYQLARDEPSTLVVGLDSARENLEELSWKASRTAKKGGLDNVLYVWGVVEDAPAELRGRADAVQVVLPWGKLMVGLLLGLPDVLDGLRCLGRAGTTFRAVVNAEVWGDPIPVEVRDLPELTVERVTAELAPTYAAHGIEVDDVHVLSADEVRAVRSTWSKRLASSRPGRHPRFVDLRGRYL